MFLLKPLIDCFTRQASADTCAQARLCWDTLVLKPLLDCSERKSAVSVEAANWLLRSTGFCWRLCWSRCSIESDEARLFLLKPLFDCFARQASADACAEARLCWSTLVLKHACAEARWSIVSDETWLFLLRPLIDCLARQASSEALVRLLLLELDKLLVRFLLLKPLLDCFHWGLNVPVEAAIRLLLLERCSIASFDELLQRPLFDCFARQASASACAEARLYWSRCSIASDEARLFLLKPVFDCFAWQASDDVCAEARLCWGTGQLLRMKLNCFCWSRWSNASLDKLLLALVLRPLVNCFGWISNVSAEAADRLLRSTSFCWHLCSGTFVLRHACAEAAVRLLRTKLGCFCWSR
jgi:hypothetical protein